MSRAVQTRRGFIKASGALAIGTLAACRRPGAPARDALIVYCSADAEIAQPVFEAFTAATGVPVRPVLDTEATKTTGLVNRLLSERAAPKADAWWSSEPFGTIKLAKAGVLQRFRAARAEDAMKPTWHTRWPEELRDISRDESGSTDRPLWYGLGSRLRVTVYHTGLVKPADLPTDPSTAPGTLGQLTLNRFKGRVAIARPQFGTTRGHMALIRTLHGDDRLRAWLAALKASDVQLLDGNASVVRAVASGKAHIGLTDSDDVFAGQRQQWPVDMLFEPFQPIPVGNAIALPPPPALWPSGPASLPNTCAIIAGTPRSAEAGAFIEHLLSPATQRLMAASDSRNIPVDESLRKQLAAWAPAPPEGVRVLPRRLEEVESSIEPAMKAVEDVLGA